MKIEIKYIPTYDEVVVLDAYCNCGNRDELMYNRQLDEWICPSCGGKVYER